MPRPRYQYLLPEEWDDWPDGVMHAHTRRPLPSEWDSALSVPLDLIYVLADDAWSNPPEQPAKAPSGERRRDARVPEPSWLDPEPHPLPPDRQAALERIRRSMVPYVVPVRSASGE